MDNKKYLVVSIKNKEYSEYENPNHCLQRIMDIHNIKPLYQNETNDYFTTFFKWNSLKKDVLAEIIFLVGMYYEVADYRISDDYNE